MKSAAYWTERFRDFEFMTGDPDVAHCIDIFTAIQRDALESAAAICDKAGTGSITAAADVRSLLPPTDQEKP